MKLAARFNAMPRAARWAVGALVFVALFFGAIDPMLVWRANLVGRAATSEARVAELERLLAQRKESAQRVAMASRAHGPAHKPGEFEAERSAITSAIERVQREHGIVITSLEPRTISAPNSSLQEALAADQELVRLVFVMSFQGDPATIVNVLRDLEASPEIQAVGGVRITRTGRGDDRTMAARFEPETWAVRTRGGSL